MGKKRGKVETTTETVAPEKPAYERTFPMVTRYAIHAGTKIFFTYAADEAGARKIANDGGIIVIEKIVFAGTMHGARMDNIPPEYDTILSADHQHPKGPPTPKSST